MKRNSKSKDKIVVCFCIMLSFLLFWLVIKSETIEGIAANDEGMLAVYDFYDNTVFFLDSSGRLNNIIYLPDKGIYEIYCNDNILYVYSHFYEGTHIWEYDLNGKLWRQYDNYNYSEYENFPRMKKNIKFGSSEYIYTMDKLGVEKILRNENGNITTVFDTSLWYKQHCIYVQKIVYAVISVPAGMLLYMVYYTFKRKGSMKGTLINP